MNAVHSGENGGFMQTPRVTRRAFLSTGAGALGAAFAAWTGLSPGDPPLRVAVAGLGSRGTHHVQTARQLPGVQVTAVCDTAASRTAAVLCWARAQDGRAPDAFSSLHALLAARCADVIILATPPASRMALTLATLNSGRHVFVERPARSLPQAHRLRDAAAASRAIAQDALHALDPYWPLEIEDELAAARVGDPFHAEVFVDASDDAAPVLDVARRALRVETPVRVQSAGSATAAGRRETEFIFRRSPVGDTSPMASISLRQCRNGWRGIRLTGPAGTVAVERPAVGAPTAHGLVHFLAGVRCNTVERAWSLAEGALAPVLVQLGALAAERSRPIVLDANGHCTDPLVESALWAS
jgi:hypothetical protein